MIMKNSSKTTHNKNPNSIETPASVFREKNIERGREALEEMRASREKYNADE